MDQGKPMSDTTKPLAEIVGALKERAKNDNHKRRAPAVMVTPCMMESGMAVLHKMAASPDNFTDGALVEGIFLHMWEAYWLEIDATHRKKTAGRPVVALRPHGLILPPGMRPKPTGA
jgi:hypothetical protein